MVDVLALKSRKRELHVKRYYHNEAYKENCAHNKFLLSEMAKLDDDIMTIDFEIAKAWNASEREKSDALWAIRRGLER